MAMATFLRTFRDVGLFGLICRRLQGVHAHPFYPIYHHVQTCRVHSSTPICTVLCASVCIWLFKIWPFFLLTVFAVFCLSSPHSCCCSQHVSPPSLFSSWGRILGSNWDKEFSSWLFTVTSTNRFNPPPPPNKSDYAQKPQWNWTFMNSASVVTQYCLWKLVQWVFSNLVLGGEKTFLAVRRPHAAYLHTISRHFAACITGLHSSPFRGQCHEIVHHFCITRFHNCCRIYKPVWRISLQVPMSLKSTGF
jgi:hypothetical protein